MFQYLPGSPRVAAVMGALIAGLILLIVSLLV